jgi:hypothetical protein
MSFNYSPKVVTNGLVLCVDAANQRSYTSGSATWFDLTGNFNNGTLTNGPTFDSTNGGSIVFDGTNDYVNCGSGSSINITGTGLTLSAWIKRTASNTNGAYKRIIEKAATYPALQYSFVITPPDASVGEGRLLLDLYINNALPSSVTGSIQLQLNTWYFVNTTYDGSFRRIYVNGNLDGQLATTGNITSTNSNLVLGDYLPGPGGSYAFKGNIANTQIYNRALSATEILQNYNATKTRFGL